MRPVIGHSLTPRGASMEAAFACSTHGSLIMFTVNPFVALMLRLVSFSCCELVRQLNERSGGFGATCAARQQSWSREKMVEGAPG